MTDSPVHIGSARVQPSADGVQGDYVSMGTERYYRIANYDRMPPFFMSVVSGSNHWLFISSNGGMTAGRRNADNALFPYYTEDKIHDNADHTGSRTIVRVVGDGTRHLWEPFDRQCGTLYRITRNLYKNVYGNRLMFEEVNHDLDLVFRYTWAPSDRFGFVKHAELRNTGSAARSVELLDGIENILPCGMVEFFQSKYSCLGDAYKQNEVETATGIATFALSSIPGDSPEPAEALRATVCWSTRPAETVRLLSSLQLDTFRSGGDVERETRVCGRRGAYFVREAFDLAPGAREDWLIVADVECGHPELASLKRTLATTPDVVRLVQEDIDAGTDRLAAIVGRADGLQTTGDTLGSNHHFANVLFNVMRGGVFESAYTIPVADLRDFVRAFNRETWARNADFLGALDEQIELGRLVDETRSLNDPALLRLVFEYLPISFSRRHGDPSRPWNQFAINVKNRDGSKVLDYQGNWRDIFQNWEALCLSFPEYLESVITRFVNTTTADGYNPYRVTKDGYDWEAPDPDDPWAHFGYWGDHQLIYLLKFLEWSRRHHPGRLERMLGEQRFVYADVPYDIKPYEEILRDPRASITYATDRAAQIAARVDAIGFDGRYLTDPSGEICHATLTEKLLVPLLAKIGNFVPGGGFWMNTQRPEWNDANNALAGFGVSMVTLYYARRYVAFCRQLLDGADVETADLNEEVARWLQETRRVLEDNRYLLDHADIGDADRKALLDRLGRAAEHYRSGLYEQGLRGQRTPVPASDLSAFFDVTLAFFDQTIRLNRRDDDLYHAYNVLELSPDGVALERLHPMLEGQVAVLSSGALSPAEALSVARALRHSDMYRADQHSYLLYPERVLPSFFEKNTIPAAQADRSDLVRQLIADGNTDLVEQDVDGAVHFNGLFRNIRDVHAALERLSAKGYGDLVARESALVGELFESVFEHKRFTGRSGTFYGYEGIGCIYWHMVSKLLLAAQESCLAAAAGDDSAFGDLAAWYYDVRAGIGFNKAPDVYGAFPTDPYSHTPGYAGAKQPGMTGQVKEEIITRLGELGVSVRDGMVRFDPVLLRQSEFLREPETFEYYDVGGRRQSVELETQTLGFTYCQVPIVYRRSDETRLTLHFADGTLHHVDGLVMDEDASREIFRRSGAIVRVEVSLTPGLDG
ncbi:MAG: hypothetical protein AMS20_12565 [Gemmatimonas sp. SG8_28]|nr:MAG: hypothetical protein AMS20_12565 [Gemmatimonas sp. SG8_28]